MCVVLLRHNKVGTPEGFWEALDSGTASGGRNPAAETQAAATSAGKCLFAQSGQGGCFLVILVVCLLFT